MSKKHKLKAREKVTQKISRSGLVECNQATGEETKIGKRELELDLRGGEPKRERYSQVGNASGKKSTSKRHNLRCRQYEQDTTPKKADDSAASVQPPQAGTDTGAVMQQDAPEMNGAQTVGTAKHLSLPKPDIKPAVTRRVSFSQTAAKHRTPNAGKEPLIAAGQETPKVSDSPRSGLRHGDGSGQAFTRGDMSVLQSPQKQETPSEHQEETSEQTTVADNGIAENKAESKGNPAADIKSAAVKPPDAPPPAAIPDAKNDEGGTPPPDFTSGDVGENAVITPPKSAYLSADRQDAPNSELKTVKQSKLRFSGNVGEPKTPSRSEVKQQKHYGKAQKQADKAVTKLDKAKSKLPAKKKLKTERAFNEQTGKVETKLYFESGIKPQARHLQGSLLFRPVKAAGNLAIAHAHRKIYQAERENAATEAAHKGEIFVEGIARTALRHHKTAPYRKVQKLEHAAQKKSINAAYQKALAENPKLKSNPLSRAWQKRKIKKDYAKAAREAENAAERIKKAGTMTGKAAQAIGGAIKRHPVAAGAVVLIILFLFSLMSLFGAFGSAGSGGLGGILSASYLAEDADIDGAELVYTEWETDLEEQIANAASSHGGYDEYRYNVDDISHNPFELMAYLTAKYQGFTYAAVYADLQALFNEQYSLMFTPTTETRYADPTDADEDGDYEPYDWRVMTVTLTARNFTDVVASHLSGYETAHYDLLMQSKGARQYLANPFGDLNWLPYVSSYYGYRIHPITGAENYHKGVDIALPQGAEIHAGQDGTVTFAGNSGDYGNVVVIENADGLVSKYAHCDTLSVGIGQSVKSGDVIATVGNTGASTGAHLHLEIIKGNLYLNPLFFCDSGSFSVTPSYGPG